MPGARHLNADSIYNLCITNLVTGTLYRAKGNFEFGVTRIIKSLEPYDREIGVGTWYYAKRCFLAQGETLGKNMILLKDDAFDELICFGDAAMPSIEGSKERVLT